MLHTQVVERKTTPRLPCRSRAGDPGVTLAAASSSSPAGASPRRGYAPQRRRACPRIVGVLPTITAMFVATRLLWGRRASAALLCSRATDAAPLRRLNCRSDAAASCAALSALVGPGPVGTGPHGHLRSRLGCGTTVSCGLSAADAVAVRVARLLAFWWGGGRWRSSGDA